MSAHKLLHPDVEPLIRSAEEACALAKKLGADGAEAVVRSGSELSVKVRLGEIELLQEAASKALGLRVFRDHRAALTYTSDFTPAGIERFVRDSVELAKLAADKIETGELPIVFDPDSGRAILGLLLGVISGGAIYRKSSYLIGREGSEVASKLVHIVDDPLIARAPGSRPYDGDGLASRKNPVVDGGVLKTYLLDVYSARKLGRKSNGCASRGVGGSPHVSSSNFIMQKGTTPK